MDHETVFNEENAAQPDDALLSERVTDNSTNTEITRSPKAHFYFITAHPVFAALMNLRNRYLPPCYRSTLLLGAVITVLVLTLNLVLSAVAFSISTSENPARTIFSGDCGTSKKLNTALHFVVNILSTALLGVSNFAMQVLIAPTRGELDTAHEKGRWLHIGVIGMRNFRSIKFSRTCMWIAFAVSSLPLHLLYNSVVFPTIVSRTYYVFNVDEDFMRANRANSIVSVTFTDGGRHHFSLNNSELRDDYHFRSQLDELLHLNDSSLQRLDAEHCIMAYSEIPQTERSHVLLVSPTSSSNSSEYNVTVNLVEQFDSGSNADPFDWICRDVDTLTSCSDMVDMMRRNASNWQPFGRRVSYCLSYMQPGGCAVNFSVHIAVTIIVFNLAKLMLLLVVIFGMQHRPLLTTGDAITSFLARPDQFTQDCCLLDQNDVRSAHSRWPVVMARRWTTRRYFRGKAAGAWRWGVCLAIYSGLILVCAMLLQIGVSGLEGNRSMGALARMGIGRYDPRAGIGFPFDLPETGTPALMTRTLIANSGQLILSVTYVSYNALLTSMCGASEVSHFAYTRKSLRVSHSPEGSQRATYFLQLPLVYGIPLQLAGAVLHWLVSQSIFVMFVQPFGVTGQAEEQGFWVPGYSPIGILLLVIMACVLVVSLIGYALVPLRPGLPLMANCSVAIAATCHSDDNRNHGKDDEKGRGSVMWGVTKTPEDNKPGHCGFSDGPVSFPVEAAIYQ